MGKITLILPLLTLLWPSLTHLPLLASATSQDTDDLDGCGCGPRNTSSSDDTGEALYQRAPSHRDGKDGFSRSDIGR